MKFLLRTSHLVIWLYHNFIGMDDKFYIIETRGNYQTPPADEIDWETYDSSDYKFDYLAVVDRSTSLTVNTIDVKKDITSSELSVDNAYFRNGKITVNTKTKERDYDPLTGELLDTRSRTQSDDDAITDNYSFGDYKVETVVFQTETNHRYSKITVTSPDPEEAQLIANTYAAVAPEFIAKVMKTVEPSIFQEARLPVSPVSPSKSRNLILGFLIGAMLAVGVITMMFVMDDKVRTSDDITKLLGLPTLGVVTMQNAMHGDNKRSGKGARK